MDDLISRQEALDAIDKNRQGLLSLSLNSAEHILVHYGRRVIEELPTIEPKHGEWIFHSIESPYRWECNKCGDKVRARYNFCPNCGAKMERSEE